MTTPDIRIYNIYEAAEALKLEESSVRRLAARLGVGRKLVEGKAGRGWYFTEADLEKLRTRPIQQRRHWQPGRHQQAREAAVV